MESVSGKATTILAIDYGARRTGLAVGQFITGRAQALKTLVHPWHRPDWPALDRVVERWRPMRLVVGIPPVPEGANRSAASVRRAIERFCQKLIERYRLPLDLADESYSSAIASSELAERRRSRELGRRVRKTDIDAMAACIILEGWLASAAGREAATAP